MRGGKHWQNNILFYLKLIGVVMGRIRVPDQPDTFARFHSDDLWKVFSQGLCCLFDCVFSWNHPFHANIICRIPTCSDIWAYDGKIFINHYPNRLQLGNMYLHPVIAGNPEPSLEWLESPIPKLFEQDTDAGHGAPTFIPWPSPPHELMNGDAIGWGCMCGEDCWQFDPARNPCPIVRGLSTKWLS